MNENQPFPVVVTSDYHNETFYDLIPRYRGQIDAAMFEAPKALRRRCFLPQLPTTGWVDGDTAWAACASYLTAIEAELAQLLSQHSVFFWLHLYRRIGVRLAPGHDDKIDPATIGLVRQIAELAIMKFGSLSRTNDLQLSPKVKFSQVLGGQYKRVLQKALRKRGQAMRRFVQLQRTPQWVATDFHLKDLISVFGAEGLAYEYWKTTALMRALGKGAAIMRSHDDWVDYRPNSDLSKLIQSYDSRIGGHSGATLAGTWIGTRTIEGKGVGSWMLLPRYNVEGLGAEDGIALLGVRLPPKRLFKPNFVLNSMDTTLFRDANEVLTGPFYKRRGYRLEALLTALWGLSNAVLMPSRLLVRNVAEKRDLLGPQSGLTLNMLNMMQRGYGTFATEDGVVSEILHRADLFDAPFSPWDADEIEAATKDLTLTVERQMAISLWSGGPRYPIVPFGPTCTILDPVSIPPILQTLFVGVRHDGSRRGNAFEDEFRSAVAKAGFPIQHSGRLDAHDGQTRELDASVRVGNTLYLFECVSIERPLDFEIGRIATIKRRTSELKSKLRQALTLKDFISRHPDGRNYDFRWATNLRAFVVSPFIEWIWSRAECVWDGSRPRVISAEEAIDYLRQDSPAVGN